MGEGVWVKGSGWSSVGGVVWVKGCGCGWSSVGEGVWVE